MSWSLQVRGVTSEDVKEKILQEPIPHQANPEESEQQRTLAADLAEQIINSSFVGEGTFTVNTNGHANKEFKDQPGFANDMITVSVYREVKS